MYLPLVAANPTPIPTLPPQSYGKINVRGGSLGWPAASSPDVNLALRGYITTTAYLGLVNYNGDTDTDPPPQLAAIFNPERLPNFSAAFQVYDWDWNCNPPTGCRGKSLDKYPVTLIEMTTVPGEPLSIAHSQETIGSGFAVMVLYAEPGRLALTYTDEDSPANGYMLHFEDVVVAPELVALYRQLDGAGRKELPALRNGEIWGMAKSAGVKVAIRDTGTFMDPRACKDWWVDYRAQCTVQMWRPAWAVPRH